GLQRPLGHAIRRLEFWAEVLGQLRSAYLASRSGGGNLFGRNNPTRDLEIGDPGRNPTPEGLLRGLRMSAEHDRGGHLFAEGRMRVGEHNRLGHIRIRQEDTLDLVRRHLLSAPADQLLEPALKEEVTAAVQRAEIAGPEPPLAEGGDVGLRKIFVARSDGRTLNHDL